MKNLAGILCFKRYTMNELMISPEGFEVAKIYLEVGHDAQQTANILGLPVEKVDKLLNTREVKDYIDRVFNETGYRNRDKLAQVWDAVLQAKIQEIQETGMASNKDIVEILEKLHKFNMDQLQMQLKLKEVGLPKTATQINIGSNYNSLLEKILNPK